MDQTTRGRSPSLGQPHIKQSHSPSPAPPFNPEQPVGLGLGLDNSPSHFAQADFSQSYNNNNGAAFIANQQAQASYPPTTSAGLVPAQELPLQDPSAPPTSAPIVPQPQPGYNLSPSFQHNADFSLFPTATTQGEQFTAPLFDPQPNQPDMNDMASPQTHHTPTPPHMLNPEPHQAGQHSPSFNQHQFAASPGHSRHASLGPEAALLPGQMSWDGPSFQTHRRSPSEYSDVSSVTHSPNMSSQDNFDQISNGHSPMQRAQDGSLYDAVPFENFNINDNPAQGSPNPGRSPSHSPAISPRVMPAQIQGPPSTFALAPHSAGFVQPPPFVTQPGEAFPTLPQEGMGEMHQVQMTTPSISFTPAPPGATFDPSKPHIDQGALTPPDRGRTPRRRAHTDPYSSGAVLARPPAGLSPHLGAELRSDTRSLSPLDRQPSPSNRRKSIGSVPNNEMALRLADPEYHGGAEGGTGAKRQQKHPATFSCHLCPKKFTRAYNLRSHLRTHTDERPFVCSVCGKAFARQHDRKRHEGLHSGEKKFVCKGDLKAGGQWGCGRRFARADALGRHFRSEAGRICIKPLLDEEMMERQRAWHEQQQRNMAAQQMAQSHMLGDPNAGYPVDPSGGYALPQALLAQYPALAQMNWSAPDMSGGGSGMDDDLSGRSSFDASDYDEGDDGGYVSGPGTGFGAGGMNEGFGEVGYSSDFGARS